MNCQHINKTLTATSTDYAGRIYKTWYCEDCDTTVNECIEPKDVLYACNGDCTDCPEWAKEVLEGGDAP